MGARRAQSSRRVAASVACLHQDVQSSRRVAASVTQCVREGAAEVAAAVGAGAVSAVESATVLA